MLAALYAHGKQNREYMYYAKNFSAGTMWKMHGIWFWGTCTQIRINTGNLILFEKIYGRIREFFSSCQIYMQNFEDNKTFIHVNTIFSTHIKYSLTSDRTNLEKEGKFRKSARNFTLKIASIPWSSWHICMVFIK